MGQDESTIIDESIAPDTLESRTVEAVAKYIKDGRARRIVVMVGAGISTSAGIPDFRSPDTGLYANLSRLNLPYAEAVFDISYFRQNPLAYYTLARELFPGKYRPTITHSFLALLHHKGLLLKLFTQNIDCLEREAGVPGDVIVEAHGSFANQHCIDCHAAYPEDKMKAAIQASDVPHCEQCNGLVKHDIVFFGEQLPADFFANREKPGEADLCIVMGTSLTVQPFASLPGFCQRDCPRLLINQEQVGNLGARGDDVLLLGDCDTGVRKLAQACGWLEELEELWARTVPQDAVELGKEQRRTKDQAVEDEVSRLADEVDQTLKLSRDLVNGHDKEANGMRSQEEIQPSKVLATPDMGNVTDKGESKAETPADIKEDSQPKVPDIEPGGGGLAHVFPHMGKKSSL